MTILVARHEKECGRICRKMPYLLTSQGRTSETGKDITAARDPQVEVGPNNDGLRLRLAQNPTKS